MITDQHRERLLKGAISVFIILYLGLTLASLSPEKVALRRTIVDATGPFYRYLGLWQGWELFAPNIRNVNSHSIALIRFDDGSMTAWPLPRFEEMDVFEKYRYDKFRKWNGDNAQWDRYKEFWPGLARYVGRLHYNGKGPKPVSFTLMRFTALMPKPETGVKRDSMPKHDRPECSFFYSYKDEDLSI